MQVTARHWRSGIVLIVIIAALVVPVSTASARNVNPGVLPIQSHPSGLTYGQWSAKWWTWAASFPLSDNPLADPTGQDCALGQSGHVWYLAGTLGGSATRSCTVPHGKAILFPVFNAEWSIAEAQANGNTCIVPASPSGTSDAALRACATAQADHAFLAGAALTASVDGTPLQNLTHYQALSPAFNLTGAPTNPVIPAGPTRSVANGFWIMLTPLPSGHHTIHFSAVVPFPEISFTLMVDVTYHVTIAG